LINLINIQNSMEKFAKTIKEWKKQQDKNYNDLFGKPAGFFKKLIKNIFQRLR